MTIQYFENIGGREGFLARAFKSGRDGIVCHACHASLDASKISRSYTGPTVCHFCGCFCHMQCFVSRRRPGRTGRAVSCRTCLEEEGGEP